MIILYGSAARNEATYESDIDIAITVKKEMDNQTKKRFINWAADMDIRYEKIFSIVDIQEDNINNNAREAMWKYLEAKFYTPHQIIGSGTGSVQNYMYNNYIFISK